MQRSLYIQLLSLLPWQGEEELCLQKSSSAAATSRGRHGDNGPSQRASEHDCTVRQTCRKGRRDVLFSHPTQPDTPPTAAAACVHSAVSEASVSAWSKRRHKQSGLCRHVQCTDCLRRALGCLFQHPDGTAGETPPFFHSAAILLHPKCDTTNILLYSPPLSVWLGCHQACDMTPAVSQSAPIMCLPLLSLVPLHLQIKASY